MIVFEAYNRLFSVWILGVDQIVYGMLGEMPTSISGL